MQKDSITKDKWTVVRSRESTKEKLIKIKDLRNDTFDELLNYFADNYINQKGL